MRRTGIAVGAVAALLLPLGAPGAEGTASRPSHVQVAAHPDDDILFMNPDESLAIRSGARVTSVYLTAGESDVEPSGEYAAQRQAGAHAAFAYMAGVPE